MVLPMIVRNSHAKKPARKVREPDDALLVTTYSQLEDYLAAFAAGHLNLLILVGRHGLAKSRTARQVLGDDVCWITGNATPFGMYTKLYRHRDQFVVIDDVDSLYADRSGIRLLKCLCQTEAEKHVAWQSAARNLEREAIPREFVTTSRAVIISNDWKTLNRNVAALQDRGHVLLFEPTAVEVHRKAGQWFSDADVYDWFGRNLHLVSEPSLRNYLRALELKQAGLSWRKVAPESPTDRRSRLVADLKADTSFPTEEARAREFTKRGGGCRATYFNHTRRMRRRYPSCERQTWRAW